VYAQNNARYHFLEYMTIAKIQDMQDTKWSLPHIHCALFHACVLS